MSNPSLPAPSPDAPKSTRDPTHTASSRSGRSDRLRIVRNLLIATENNRAASENMVRGRRAYDEGWAGSCSGYGRCRLDRGQRHPRRSGGASSLRRRIHDSAFAQTRQRTGSCVRIAQGSQFAQRVRDIGTPGPCRLGGRHHRIYHRCNAAGLLESVDESAHRRYKLGQLPVPSTSR